MRAKELGLKVCLIDKGAIGGTCLNLGCIPTKTLIQSAKVYTATITTETALKGSMSTMKESLNADIKALRDKVKLAHKAVVDALLTLPKPTTPVEVSNKTETSTEVNNKAVENTTTTTTTIN